MASALAFAGGTFLPGWPALAGLYGDARFDPQLSPNPIVRQDLPSGVRPDRPLRPRSDAKPEKAAAKSEAKPEVKDFGPMPKGPLQIVVSIADQRVTLYSNGTRVAQGPVSTGVEGRPTPTGVFSIIQKDRFHHSNLYSNAPMPYMERITWSGVALHEGPLPGYPASHGCIRLSHDFAARLWVVARLGVRVIVAKNEVVPGRIRPSASVRAEAEVGGRSRSGQGLRQRDPVKPAEAGGRVSFAQATATDALRGTLVGADPAKPAAAAEDQQNSALATPKLSLCKPFRL